MAKHRRPEPVVMPINEGGNALKMLIQELNPDVDFEFVVMKGESK